LGVRWREEAIRRIYLEVQRAILVEIAADLLAF
jgi:hypothetical protein